MAENENKETSEVDKNKCIGCGSCVGVCPVGAISLDPNDGKAVIDQNKCIKCHSCEGICPMSAITIKD